MDGSAIDSIILPRSRDLGGFEVGRVLPVAGRRMVGPFVFLDRMGPAEFPPGRGIDVRPHPHIGLATVTYLLRGEIMHRDSLGTVQAIRPGAVNWMTAGRGITHSERTGTAMRAAGGPLWGLQSWVALPRDAEETTPAFAHYGAEALPLVEGEGRSIRVICGTLFGASAPVATLWDTLFADVMLSAGAVLPLDDAAEERAVYLVEGRVKVDGVDHEPDRLLVLKPGATPTLAALTDCRLVLLGGATMDGPRHIWWNFVSSRPERIEQAKADWKAGRFPMVPAESEFIPLPEG
ncbi:MAG: pirin family protein [Thalassobaculales bacterium]